MDISTEIGSLRKLGNVKEILNVLKQANFSSYDFSMFNSLSGDLKFIDFDDYKERAKDLRRYADSIGIKCNQSHAPFPLIFENNVELTKQQHKLISRAIEVSGILGAKVCVVHPWNNYSIEQNVEVYSKFSRVAIDCNVKIGVENMWNWDSKTDRASPCACSLEDDFVKQMSLLDKNVFVACLDIGHAEMFKETSTYHLIIALGDRLKALHIHDNDKRYDLHTLPYTSKIDFSKMIEALKLINYDGDITFECDSVPSKLPNALLIPYFTYLQKIGEYFKSEIKIK